VTLRKGDAAVAADTLDRVAIAATMREDTSASVGAAPAAASLSGDEPLPLPPKLPPKLPCPPP